MRRCLLKGRVDGETGQEVMDGLQVLVRLCRIRQHDFHVIHEVRQVGHVKVLWGLIFWRSNDERTLS